MSIERVNKSFSEVTNMRLASNSYLNMFNILKNHHNEYFLNIFKSYVVDKGLLDNEDYFHFYQAEEEDWWENIADKYYGTPTLWWLVALANEVQNPFEEMGPGKNIKVLKKTYLYTVLKDIQKIAEI